MWHIFYNWLSSIHKVEWFVLVALAVHIVAVPYTEADEETFNMDAIHDILYHKLNFAKYHHLEHPGLVSRTFIGPLAVASIALPFRTIFGLLRLSKFWTLLAVRFVLGLATLTPFFLLARSIERRYYFFDSRVGTFLRIITATQFYFLYYASRPTSNTYAMILFLLVYYRVHEKDYILAAILATVCVFQYQFELILFFIFFFLINFKKEEVITQCRIAFVTLLISLAIAMPIDAYFWGSYFVWPEARAIKIFFWDSWWEYKKYNFITFLRFHFTAVPRSLLLWHFLYEEGYRIHQRLQTTLWIKFCLPAKIFFYLYSIVGRNEFHFILYISQMYNASAAVYCAHYCKRFLQARALNFRKQFFIIIGVLFLNAAISIQLMYASNHSYPGAKALVELQSKEHYSRDKPINIHMDKYCAETGITRFVQFYDNWTYNKTENLQPADAFQFDYILIGSTNKDKLIEDFAKANLSFPFADYFSIEAYHQIQWRLTFHYYWIPLYKPEVHYERAIVMKKKN